MTQSQAKLLLNELLESTGWSDEGALVFHRVAERLEDIRIEVPPAPTVSWHLRDALPRVIAVHWKDGCPSEAAEWRRKLAAFEVVQPCVHTTPRNAVARSSVEGRSPASVVPAWACERKPGNDSAQ